MLDTPHPDMDLDPSVERAIRRVKAAGAKEGSPFAAYLQTSRQEALERADIYLRAIETIENRLGSYDLATYAREAINEAYQAIDAFEAAARKAEAA